MFPACGVRLRTAYTGICPTIVDVSLGCDERGPKTITCMVYDLSSGRRLTLQLAHPVRFISILEMSDAHSTYLDSLRRNQRRCHFPEPS